MHLKAPQNAYQAIELILFKECFICCEINLMFSESKHN